MVPRQKTGQHCIARHDGNVVCYSVSIAPTLSRPGGLHRGLLCCGIQGRRRRRCSGEAHPASTSGSSRLSWSCRWRPRSADGTPFSQPQHEVEQSRGPVQEKQERLASVEVEANEQFVLSTTRSATESSPGGPTRKQN